MATCVCRHGCATVVPDTGDLCDPCWKAGCVRASELISRAPAYPTDQADDIRAERDQARSDLAAERVASAEAARALEVATAQLDDLQGMYNDQRADHLRCHELLAASETALEVARKALEEAVALLERAVKYADEDKMITPGATRLQRCLDAAESRLPGLRSMAGAASEPAATIAAPLSMVEREFDCPTCEAKAGSQCVSITDGNPRRGPHDHRVRLARVRSIARSMAGEKEGAA